MEAIIHTRLLEMTHQEVWLAGLKSRGLAGSEKLQIVEVPQRGNCLFACGDIAEGHEFQLPSASGLFIDFGVVRASPIWAALAGLVPVPGIPVAGDVVAVALFLLCEKAKGAASEWVHYMEMVPKEFDSTIFWNAQERETLAGTVGEPSVHPNTHISHSSSKRVFTCSVWHGTPQRCTNSSATCTARCSPCSAHAGQTSSLRVDARWTPSSGALLSCRYVAVRW